MQPRTLAPRDSASFRNDPYGAFVHGECWFYFAWDERLFGYAIWGRPTADDVHNLANLLVSELDRPVHDALVDLSGLDHVEPGAFEALASYARNHARALRALLTHTAIVRPPGWIGAVVSGFFAMTGDPFPASFWSTAHEALSHLGRPDAGECAAALIAARASVTQEPPLLTTLRGFLARQLATAEAQGAARALGMSERTLQRRLSEVGTSFVEQLQAARLEAASHRLRTEATPVTVIAAELGFKTSQHFAAKFRERFGVSPTDFRDRRGG